MEGESTAIQQSNEGSDESHNWEALMGQDLQKKIIHPAKEGAPSVQPQDVVVVDIVGWMVSTSDGAVSKPTESNFDELRKYDGAEFQRVSEWWLVIGEKDVLPALEMGVRFMAQGERALIWSHSKYAYGPGQRITPGCTVPPQSNVLYEVTLRRIIPSEEQDRAFQLKLCQSKKTIANDIYNHDDVINNSYASSRAVAIYKRISELLEHMLTHKDENGKDDSDEVLSCLLDGLNNIAAVHLKCKRYHEAKEACVLVLQKDPNNFKALLRAAKASLLDPASSFAEVNAAISAAAQQCGNNTDLEADVRRLKSDFSRRKKAHDKREKNMYSAMAKATVKPNTTTADQLDSKKERKRNESSPHSEDTDQALNAAVEAVADPTVLSYIKHLPWIEQIIPYGLQIISPFIMYYFFTVTRNGRQGDDAFEKTPEQQSEL